MFNITAGLGKFKLKWQIIFQRSVANKDIDSFISTQLFKKAAFYLINVLI